MLQLTIHYPRYSRLHFNTDDYFAIVMDKIDSSFKPLFNYENLLIPIDSEQEEYYRSEGFLVGSPSTNRPSHYITLIVLKATFNIPSCSIEEQSKIVEDLLDLYQTNASKYSVTETFDLYQEISL